MTEFQRRDSLPHPPAAVWDWLIRPGAAARLFGAGQTASLAQGTELAPALDDIPGAVALKLSVTSLAPGREIALEQASGPFTRFRLRLSLTPEGEAGCLLVSALEHTPGPGLRLRPGNRLRGREQDAARWLERLHGRLAADLDRHERYAPRGKLRVAVSGASGLVGNRLCAFLRAGGHTVLTLVRDDRRGNGGELAVPWNPATGEIDAEGLDGTDAVVHLAGVGIAAGRWNPARKAAIRDSRVQGTDLLARTLAGLSHPPRVLVSASAIGYYGDTGDTPVDEDAPPGAGFLADVCRAWEAALEPAEAAGLRTVRLRTGMVLAREGGALAAMLPAFRLGLGGPLGSGRQYQSWIHAEDLITVIQRALFEDGWRGAVNAVVPEPVRQRNFARALGRVLHRPAVAPLPAFVVRGLFGEMGQALLLEGQRVMPARLQAAGFDWALPGLEEALAAELD